MGEMPNRDCRWPFGPPSSPPELRISSRRSFLRVSLFAAAAAIDAFPVRAVSGHGQVKLPIPVPDAPVNLHDGSSTTLAELADNHVTAVQLMFTSCTTTCPIQAAIFQQVQSRLSEMPGRNMQLLSLSVDPQNDTPAALNAWRERFHAGPSWLAASCTAADTPRLEDFFAKSDNSADHSTQVSILDRQARLVWRTYELPAAQEILTILEKI
jgi:protein SCO1